MTTKLAIFNQAIAACGSRAIIDDPAENSNEAKLCSVFYDQSLSSTLQMGWWNFAQRVEYAALYAAAPGTPESSGTNTSWVRTDPPPPWLYAYRMPSDVVQVRMVQSEVSPRVFSGPQRYRSMTMYDNTDATYVAVIVCNAPSAIITYTANVVDTSLFDAQFTDAVVARLAFDICMALTGDAKLTQLKANVWKQMQQQALASDANEGLGYTTITPESLAVRGFRETIEPPMYTQPGESD